MIGRGNKELYEAMVALNNTAGWRVVRAWLDAEIGRLQTNMEQEHDQAALRWHQGALQTLRALTARFDNARDVLDKGLKE